MYFGTRGIRSDTGFVHEKGVQILEQYMSVESLRLAVFFTFSPLKGLTDTRICIFLFQSKRFIFTT